MTLDGPLLIQTVPIAWALSIDKFTLMFIEYMFRHDGQTDREGTVAMVAAIAIVNFDATDRKAVMWRKRKVLSPTDDRDRKRCQRHE